MTRLKVIGMAGVFSMLALVNGTQAQEVQELANRWTQTYNEYDSAALAALYHEDAIVLLHGALSISGRAAIRDFWADDMQVNSPLTVLTVTHSVDDFDMKEVHGSYEVLNRVNGLPLGHGRFAHIWTRQNGEWLLARELWDQPLEPFVAE